MNSSPSLLGSPIAAYAESFIAGRRVVVFGSVHSALAQHLIDRGARLVHVYDPDVSASPKTDKGASHNIRTASLSVAASELQPQSFDFGVIENLNGCPDPKLALQQMAQAVSLRGAALVGVASPQATLQPGLAAGVANEGSALGYYELYDHVADHFADVRMLGQLPFVGYAIADFSAEREADVTVDTAFMPGGAEEPAWFWALASHEPVVGEAFAIIQLPLASVMGSPQVEPQLQPQLEQPVPSLAPLQERIAALESELKQRDHWLTDVEARATAADARADQAEAEVEQLRVQEPAKVVSPDSAEDIDRLEGLLKGRALVIETLEQRLVEAERVVGDLVRELEILRQKQKPAAHRAPETPQALQLQARLDNLALANAERAALLATAEATIRELEHKLVTLAATASSHEAAPTAGTNEEVELAH